MYSSAKISHIALKEGTKVFYREIGKPSNPKLLLLHGYPTSSYMYRNLMPLLASNFHVIAPDLPGFGFTETPDDFSFTFETLTNTIDSFLEELHWSKFAMYVFDYGAPVGFRLALKDPRRITAVISQNGNAYEEGIDDRFWGPIRQYWESANEENEVFIDKFTAIMNDKEQNIDAQYYEGVLHPEAIDPAPAILDDVLIRRPGQTRLQIGLFYDYRNNLKLYPQFQKFLRDSGVPVLLAWGENDIIFSTKGSEAFKKDVKKEDLRIVYYKTGHFALETHAEEIAAEINCFIFPRIVD